MSAPSVGQHLVRYGTPADQGLLLGQFLRTYDCLVLNATIVAHMPSALASFVSQRAKGKPYLIDPQTHAFQHDTSHLESSSEKSQGELKRSISTLIEEYGEPLQSTVLTKRQPVLPEDFKNDKARREFCGRVLKFQQSALTREIQESDAAKYYNFLAGKGRSAIDLGPAILIAPYFFLSANTLTKWLPRNLEFLEAANEVSSKGHRSCAAQVVLSQEVMLNDKLRERLLDAYRGAATRPSLFLLWVDEFSESEASEDSLRAYVDLLRGLGELAPLVSLYGGFFSVALMKLGVVQSLVGVTHGLEYGEDRGVVPVGGGIPVAKFYLPVLHTRLAFRDAIRAVRALGGMTSASSFHRAICDCPQCREIIRNKPETEFAEYGRTRPVTFMRRSQLVGLEYPLAETKQRCVRHYMWCKEREYSKTLSIPQVCGELDRTRKALGRVLPLEKVAHCSNWKTVLSTLDKV